VSTSRESHTARNRAIIEAYQAGESMASIADRHGLSVERIRQLIRGTTTGSPRARRATARGELGGERLRLRIGNLAKAVLVTGQAYQDPKDALNEFVSNAADAYAESGRTGERIRVMLRRKGTRAVIAIDDEGSGMSPERLRAVARNLFESTKSGDNRTLGEKAIGLLAFQQLGARCDVVSRAEDSSETWVLRLRRGEASAELARERRRARARSGTTVYISELDQEAARVLTQRKVVDYLRRRRGQAIGAGAYTIEVVEGRTAELVTAEEPEGLAIPIPARSTLWGRLEFAVYVAPDADPRRRVAVVGRAGTTIIDDIAELEEFDHEPWTSGRLSGRVAFEPLRQSAGRRAVLRDDEIFPVFHDAVRSVEPLLIAAVARMREEVDATTTERLSDALRQVFGRVLKELADLENPMRTLIESATGDDDVDQPTIPLAGAGASGSGGGGGSSGPGGLGDQEDLPPTLDELEPDLASAPEPRSPQTGAGTRSRRLPSVAPDPDPGHARSRFDPDSGLVLYNGNHADFLLVKDNESLLLDYLATLVAKEYVVYNNPRAESDELAEELVRMLVRVRRHLPQRLRRR